MFINAMFSKVVPIVAGLLLVLSSLFAHAQSEFSPASLELNCRIEPYTRVDVSSATEGVVKEILVQVNDNVSKGDVLARLEDSLESATVELRRFQAEVESDVDAQILAVSYSKRNLSRVQNLFNQKAASSAELDKAKTEHDLAIQNLHQSRDRQRQASLEFNRAEAELNRRTIYSPIDGVVLERFKEPGEHIYFEPVIQIAQLDPLRVEVYAPASLYGKIKTNMEAIVVPEQSLGRSQIPVYVDKVDRVIDAASGTFGVELSISNAGFTLPSGLKCKVRFPTITPSADWLE